MKAILKFSLVLVSTMLLSACSFKLPKFLGGGSDVPEYPDAEYQESITGIKIEDIKPEIQSGSKIPPELLPVE